MTLISLGDSHSLYSFAGVAEARIYWRGPVTMHRAARDGIASLVPGNCKPMAGDILVLSFGDIDCRAHIPKQALKNGRTSIEEVDLLCDRFQDALHRFRRACDAEVALSCVVPYAPQYLAYHLYPDEAACVADAREIRDRMNSRLAAMGVPFVDFRDAISKGDGSIQPEYSDRNVHIDPRRSEPVIDALEKCFGRRFSKRIPPWPDPKPLAEPPYYPPFKRLRKRLKASLWTALAYAKSAMRRTDKGIR